MCGFQKICKIIWPLYLFKISRSLFGNRLYQRLDFSVNKKITLWQFSGFSFWSWAHLLSVGNFLKLPMKSKKSRLNFPLIHMHEKNVCPWKGLKIMQYIFKYNLSIIIFFYIYFLFFALLNHRNLAQFFSYLLRNCTIMNWALFFLHLRLACTFVILAHVLCPLSRSWTIVIFG